MNARKSVLAVFAGFVVFASFQCQKKGGGPMSTEENKAIVRRIFEEIWNQGNLDVVDEILEPNYVSQGLADGLPPGIEGFKQWFSILSSASPDIHFTIEDQIAEGDKVVTRYTIRGTHKGELMGIAATGKQVTVTAMNISRIVGGKIVESWNNWDALGMMQQLGVVPAMGEGGE